MTNYKLISKARRASLMHTQALVNSSQILSSSQESYGYLLGILFSSAMLAVNVFRSKVREVAS